MKVAEVMSTRIVSVMPGDTVAKAAALMSEHNVGAVPVRQESAIRGVLTDRDIVIRCIAQNRDPKSVRVSDIMSGNTCTVSSNDDIQMVIDKMSVEQVRRLPVVDNGRLTGIVSLADLARAGHDVEISQALTEISMPM